VVFSRFSWVYPKTPCRCSNKNYRETAETIENVKSHNKLINLSNYNLYTHCCCNRNILQHVFVLFRTFHHIYKFVCYSHEFVFLPVTIDQPMDQVIKS